jgi:Domain of unknown function (DUF4383)
MGILAIVSGTHIDMYHNLMQLVWGALAVAVSFMGSNVRRFCVGSGTFYLVLAILGLLIGNPSMHKAWFVGPMLLQTGDHSYHLVLGLIFLGMGLLSGRTKNAGHALYVTS